MSRLELIIPAVIATIMATGVLLGNKRAAIKDSYISQCRSSSKSADECQADWWRSPQRAGWTTDDLWACWAGNPDTCAEDAKKNAAPAVAAPTP